MSNTKTTKTDTKTDAKTYDELTPEAEALAKEIRDDQEHQSYGVKPAELTAHIQGGKLMWNFKEGNPRAQRLKIAKAMDELKVTLNQLDKSEQMDVAVARIKADEKACRITLETALEGFDYNDLVDKRDVDPFELSYLASEVYSFLVVSGGRAGVRRLQMLQKLDTLNRLLTSQASETDGEHSSIGKTD